MRIRYHYQKNGKTHAYDLTGIDEYDIAMKNVNEMYKRDLDTEKNNCWAEEIEMEGERMNYKYKKLPVVIEAFQMTKERKEDHSEWPVWLNKAYRKYRFDEGSLYNAESSISTFRSKKGMFCIHTLEGEHLVQWNDYIIRGVNGELYPCKEEVFLKTYEEHKE